MIIYKKTVRRNGIDFEKSDAWNVFMVICGLMVMILGSVAMILLDRSIVITAFFGWVLTLFGAMDMGKLTVLKKQQKTNRNARRSK